MTDWLRVALLCAVFGLLSCSYTTASDTTAPESYQLTLVRHAEKIAVKNDPGLTETGHARAAFFASWLAGRDIRSIWSSDYQRTRETARPLAEALELEIEIYDPRQQQSLVDWLHTDAVNAFVVGHSNTIPELAAILCACEVEPMDDSQYERAFLLTVTGTRTTLTEIDLNEAWQNR